MTPAAQAVILVAAIANWCVVLLSVVPMIMHGTDRATKFLGCFVGTTALLSGVTLLSIFWRFK